MDITIPEKKDDLQIIEQKGENWRKLGVAGYKKRIQWQLKVGQLKDRASVLPATIEDIPEAEKRLKEIKKEIDLLDQDRKDFTSRFDDFISECIGIIKSASPAVIELTNSIIKIKQEKEKKDHERKAKEDEIQQIRHQLISAVAKYDAEFKTLIGEKINQAFTHALEKNIHPGDECNDYIDRVNFRVKESIFVLQVPELSPQYHAKDADEIRGVIKELWKINPADYVSLFVTEMEKRFSDYEVAYNNKKIALELAKKEQQERLQQIEQEKEARIVSSELDSVAIDMSVEPSGIKALKKAFEVDMPETFDNAMAIMRAFMANKQKCLDKVNISKWFAFNANSAAKALSKLKSEDNAFAPTGIVWKEVDKL